MKAKIQAKIAKLPTTPGVYFFVSGKKIVYIGKATSLRSRVRSYFSNDIAEKRGPLIEKMMSEDLDIKFEKTDSVLEALILEAELIKKHNPPYNVKGKDQRSWNYVVITDESFPRVLMVREREIASSNIKIQDSFGPFPSSTELKVALKIVRKIFPYRDRCIPSPGQGEGRVGLHPCFNYQIGLCPGVCVGKITEQEYKKTIRHIKLFFQGKKSVLVRDLEREMKALAKKKDFEGASAIKKKIFTLGHINDVALLKSTDHSLSSSFRIEAYDISHISGTNIVGVMTVVENGEAKKRDYRMFKIRGQLGADDTRALSEVFERRNKHAEWPSADLIVVDGGKAQVAVAEKYFDKNKVVGVVKDERHKPKDILGDKTMADKYKREILLANAESHRFAVAFHRKRRNLILN